MKSVSDTVVAHHKTQFYRRNSELLIRPLTPCVIQQTFPLEHICLLCFFIRRPRPNASWQLEQTRGPVKSNILIVVTLSGFGSKRWIRSGTLLGRNSLSL